MEKPDVKKVILIDKSLFLKYCYNDYANVSMKNICLEILERLNAHYLVEGWCVLNDETVQREVNWTLKCTDRLSDRIRSEFVKLKKLFSKTKKGGNQKISAQNEIHKPWRLQVLRDEVQAIQKRKECTIKISSPIKMPQTTISAANSGAQRHHVISKIRRSASKVLPLLESSPYTVESLRVRERTSGKIHTVSLKDSSSTSSASIEEATRFKNLNKISDRSYASLAKLTDLPRLTQVKQRESMLNKLLNVQSYISIKGAHVRLQHILDLKLKYDTSFFKILRKLGSKRSALKIRFGGDGTVIARKHSHVNFAASIIEECTKSATIGSLYPLAIVEGSESYETIKCAVSHIISDMNELIRNGFNVPGIGKIDVEFFICGDMKYLLLVLGLDTAACSHPCLYCEIHKDDLGSTTVEAAKRSIEEISKKACLPKTNKKKFNCSKVPIFSNIIIENYVVDILHWFLRITDALLALLIQELQGLDEANMPTSTFNLEKCGRLKQLQHKISDIGTKVGRKIELALYVKKGGNGRLDWPTIFGKDKLEIFRNLDLTEFPDMTNVSSKAYIWKQLIDHYKLLRSGKLLTDAEIAQFEHEAKQWMGTFRHVYTAKSPTPYMHIYSMHFADLLRKHRSLWPFCQELFEKFNDISTRRYHGCTNHHESSAHKQLMQSHLRCLDFIQ